MVVALPGCGSSDPSIQAKSPVEVVASSQQVAEHYTSVLASGLVQDTGNLYIRVDLHIVPGKGAVGYITYRRNDHEVYPIDIVLLGNAIYLKAHQDFYERIGDGKAARYLAEKWTRSSVDSKSMFRTLAAYTELPNLTQGFFGQHGKLSMGAMTGVVGMKVVEVKNDATDEVLYVAASGKPYPIQILKGGAVSNDGIAFDHWNQPMVIIPPSKAIDLES
ncbi:MAG: hypothetical protein WAU69_03775 [Solirubrobacteraceae bacterium]